MTKCSGSLGEVGKETTPMPMALTSSQRQAFEVTRSFLTSGGRELLFGTLTTDLPPTESETIREDDKIPQIGFVGDNYDMRRILVVGINPGNGPRDFRSQHDNLMFPALHKFCKTLNEETYAEAIAAQMNAFSNWLASKEIGPILEQERISKTDIAYINANPYRAGDGIARHVFRNVERKKVAAKNWIGPMLKALQPSIVIGHGVEASRILDYTDIKTRPLTFNRVRIKSQRDNANAGFADELRLRLAAV